MKYIEVNPLPTMCQDCQEEECYNCDYALYRWQITPEYEEHIRKILKQRAKERNEEK